jgi:hypothetical protein
MTKKRSPRETFLDGYLNNWYCNGVGHAGALFAGYSWAISGPPKCTYFGIALAICGLVIMPMMKVWFFNDRKTNK